MLPVNPLAEPPIRQQNERFSALAMTSLRSPYPGVSVGRALECTVCMYIVETVRASMEQPPNQPRS